MKYLAACLIAFSSVAASAQGYPGVMQGAPYVYGTSAAASQQNLVTPTMERERLQRAIALRSEAQALLAGDNGKLTPEHTAYIRRKACDILGGSHSSMGTNIPQRCG